MPPAPAANAAPPPTTVAGPAKLVAPRAAAASRAVPAATTGYCTEIGLFVSKLAPNFINLLFYLLYNCSCRAQVVSIWEDNHLDHLDHHILDNLGPKLSNPQRLDHTHHQWMFLQLDIFLHHLAEKKFFCIICCIFWHDYYVIKETILSFFSLTKDSPVKPSLHMYSCWCHLFCWQCQR